jgi:DNA polymerase III delta prime subunit
MNSININNIDNNILNKLNKLYETKNIPNIIFHGSNLTGKKTILEYLLKMVYKTNENFNKYVLVINCSHGKGNIKFIRENLKHFANTIINNNENYLFKSIILLNADKLTIDAQSALRRCIEIYNHSTRFFIIVEDKFKILKPILSRFSDIYCNKKLNINNNKTKPYDFTSKKLYYLNKFIDNTIFEDIDNTIIEDIDNKLMDIVNLANKLYNNGFSGNLLIQFIKNKLPDNKNKYKFLFMIDIYKKEIRNESLIILFCLNYIYFRNIVSLENISFI